MRLLGHWLVALLVTAAVGGLGVGLGFGLAAALGETQWNSLPLLVVVVVCALWAAVDSASLELHKYKGGVSGAFPILLFVGLFWVVGFPYYLATRRRAARGELPLLKKYKHEEKKRGTFLKCNSCGALQPLGSAPADCEWCHAEWSATEVTI